MSHEWAFCAGRRYMNIRNLKWKLLSPVPLFTTPWTIQSMEFSRTEYWSALPSQQRLNPGLPHCRQIYQLNHKGSPRIPEWVAYPFSSRSSRPRNWTGVSCVGKGDGNPLQYSCLENPMDKGTWQATVHGVARVGHDWVTFTTAPELQEDSLPTELSGKPWKVRIINFM